ncbi:GGDEF domain-containing protein [Micromonospora sp. WMMD812]|uniref:GGDEF domain-containing protein n=1 Tax=Micromonospora sp. WMMD812 TaxID=3015152 RepID=UPI00248B228E|nr:GGDEF domain-containing protein [Micromonospora sp. WMMD812]WBB69116.1 GGDEF domain-containing protein [Micromonospora sp. WMMD812]
MFTTLTLIASTAAALVLAGWGCYLAAVLRRVRAALADALRCLARDPLTGLLNRAGLRAAHTAIAAPQPILVALIDLDEFKTVNDTHGHDIGDALLIEIADRIDEAAALHGGVAARLAGDEYAALLPVRGSDLARIAETFVVVIAEPLQLTVGGDVVKVDATASVGIAVVDSSDGLEDVALHRADIAMYHAKRRGGNRHAIYEPGMAMPPTRLRQGPRVRDRRQLNDEATA